MKLFGKKKGVDCNPNPDGTLSCRRYVIDGNQKNATGSEVTIGADPARGCEPFFTGDHVALNDDEAEDFDKIAQQVKATCLRGVK